MHSHPADDAAFTNILLFSSAFSSSEDPSFSIVFSVSVKQSVSFLGCIMGSFTLSLLASKYVSWRGRGGKRGHREEGEEKGEGREEKAWRGGRGEGGGGGGGRERGGERSRSRRRGGRGGKREGGREEGWKEDEERKVRNSPIFDLQAQRLTYDFQCSVALLSLTSDDLWGKWVQSL